MKNIENLIREEKGQGSIEYILLAGGIIVAAVVIFAIYGQITKTAGESWNESVSNASDHVSDSIEQTMSDVL